jgi:small subunit ribosomal protein S20
MPNIKQQEKRVRVAARQRLQNLRYRSTVKTLTKRLQNAVADGDEAAVADEHRLLVRWIDRAAARGALHRNTAARKKSQAARLVASPPAPATAAKPTRSAKAPGPGRTRKSSRARR